MRAIPFVGKVGQRAVDEVEVERGKPSGGGVVAEDIMLVLVNTTYTGMISIVNTTM